MLSQELIDSATLLLVLLNPFLLCIYLLDLIEGLDLQSFTKTMVRTGLMSAAIYFGFAVVGDQVFTTIFKVRYESFLMFGGVVFLLVSIRLVMNGSSALKGLRGEQPHGAEGTALPFMLGPGTISASIVTGSKVSIPEAAGAIGFAVFVCVISIIVLKWIHDMIRKRWEPIMERYLDTIGRIMALLTGTIAVDMILNGMGQWLGTGAS
ncbi:MarC family protein [Bremerella sp. T1]|uniref:MarC family protein n=1 Tax=Bremerella sp. TYQ1 TaxID=3119568 RepID=UPI001CCE7E9C|nr:MarC family protein [Bremerella volcania]UBM35756.1 MarC family protein [Bremerella volcania]